MSSFWPRSIRLQEVWLNTLGSLIAGFIWSILMLIIIFSSAKYFDIKSTLEIGAPAQGQKNNLFPFVLSVITFIATTTSFLLGTKLLQLTDPEKYKKSSLLYSHLSIFWVFLYICFTPLYLIVGATNYENLMIIMIAHMMILAFGTSLLQEILSNYRYLLLGVYASFIGVFIAGILVSIFFNFFESWYAKLLSMLLILPIIYTSITFCKGICELLYAKYYTFSNLDPLGDIHMQLKREAEEELRELEQKNTL